MRADPNPNPNPRARRRSQRGASRCSPSSTTARASTARAQSAARSAACSPASRRSATRAIGRARTAASRARRAAAGRTPSSSGDGPTSSARTERICGRRSSVCPWADPREASSRRSQPLHQRLFAIETSAPAPSSIGDTGVRSDSPRPDTRQARGRRTPRIRPTAPPVAASSLRLRTNHVCASVFRQKI